MCGACDSNEMWSRFSDVRNNCVCVCACVCGGGGGGGGMCGVCVCLSVYVAEPEIQLLASSSRRAELQDIDTNQTVMATQFIFIMAVSGAPVGNFSACLAVLNNQTCTRYLDLAQENNETLEIGTDMARATVTWNPPSFPGCNALVRAEIVLKVNRSNGEQQPGNGYFTLIAPNPWNNQLNTTSTVEEVYSFDKRNTPTKENVPPGCSAIVLPTEASTSPTTSFSTSQYESTLILAPATASALMILAKKSTKSIASSAQTGVVTSTFGDADASQSDRLFSNPLVIALVAIISLFVALATLACLTIIIRTRKARGRARRRGGRARFATKNGKRRAGQVDLSSSSACLKSGSTASLSTGPDKRQHCAAIMPVSYTLCHVCIAAFRHSYIFQGFYQTF